MSDNNMKNNSEKTANTQLGSHEDKPVNKGEVYFANYQKNRSKMAEKIYASSYDESVKKESAPKRAAKAAPRTTPKTTPKKAVKEVPQAEAKTHIVSEQKTQAKPDGSTQLFGSVASSNEKKSAPKKFAAAMPRKAANADNVRKKPSSPSKTDAKSLSRYKEALSPKNAMDRLNNIKINDQNLAGVFKRESPELTKEERKARRKTKRALRRSQPNYLKRLLISVISIVLVTSLLSGIGIGCINDILAINGTEEEVAITVPENASTNQVIRLLKSAKLIHNKSFCNMFADFRGFGKATYLSGVYYLSTDMGLEGMLNELQGNIEYTSQETIKLTFPEGWSVQQIMDKLVKNEAIESNKKFMNALNFEYKYDFLTESEEVVTILEGFMYPDTYEFYVGESASSVIRKFLENFKNKWTTEYQQRADSLGMTVNEIITIASIIQKEAGNTEQMAGVSAVIHNRLKRSVDYPYIQCDSTANYVTKYITEIVGSGRENNYKKFYDTSEKPGLPSGPICNPGEDAIVAALYPDETIDALYFNHDDTGKIYYASNEVDFARNLEEANRINEELSATYY